MAIKVQKNTKNKPQSKSKPKTRPKTVLKTTIKAPVKAKPALKPKAKAKATAAPKAKLKVKAKLKAAVKVQPGIKQKPALRSAIKPAIKADLAKIEKRADSRDESQERNERLRKLLIRKREDIVRESKTEIKKYVAGEKKQLVETVLDDGDLSVVDLAEDISLKQLSTHRDTLLKIDHALRKFDEGTYGTCDECGDEISVERLMIMPFAIFCRDCQEDREIREKMQKEDGTI